MMYQYELRPSRLEYYPYLCVDVAEENYHSMIHYTDENHVRLHCLNSFGEMGTKNSGRWFGGLLGIYFKNQEDAVQFILSWG